VDRAKGRISSTDKRTQVDRAKGRLSPAEYRGRVIADTDNKSAVLLGTVIRQPDLQAINPGFHSYADIVHCFILPHQSLPVELTSCYLVSVSPAIHVNMASTSIRGITDCRKLSLLEILFLFLCSCCLSPVCNLSVNMGLSLKMGLS
jgi:hypothetical protein